MRLNIVWMRIGLSLGLVGWLVTGHLATVSAQSDPAGFDTVINAPPTVIDRNEAIGSTVLGEAVSSTSQAVFWAL